MEVKENLLHFTFSLTKVKEQFCYPALLGYVLWFIFYRIVHTDKDLYTNMHSIMHDPDRSKQIKQLQPVIAVY